MLAEDTKLDFDNDTLFINNAVAVDYGLGFDIGLVGGYDFGMCSCRVRSWLQACRR
jgi:hypothetical protein